MPYAAFGLLWQVLGAQLVGEHQARLLDENFIQPLDLNDNTGEQKDVYKRQPLGGRLGSYSFRFLASSSKLRSFVKKRL